MRSPISIWPIIWRGPDHAPSMCQDTSAEQFDLPVGLSRYGEAGAIQVPVPLVQPVLAARGMDPGADHLGIGPLALHPRAPLGAVDHAVMALHDQAEHVLR